VDDSQSEERDKSKKVKEEHSLWACDQGVISWQRFVLCSCLCDTDSVGSFYQEKDYSKRETRQQHPLMDLCVELVLKVLESIVHSIVFGVMRRCSKGDSHEKGAIGKEREGCEFFGV